MCQVTRAACLTVDEGDVDFVDELVFGALATAVTDAKAPEHREEHGEHSRFIKTLHPAPATKTGNETRSPDTEGELMHHVHQVAACVRTQNIALSYLSRKLIR